MEPVSGLATVALAAAVILPASPLIEVILRNVENKTKREFQLCPVEMGGSRVKPSIGCIKSGTNKLQTALSLQVFAAVPSIVTATLRLIPSGSNPKDVCSCLELFLVCGPHSATNHTSLLQISLMYLDRLRLNKVCLQSYFNLTWDRRNPPAYISCEIDGIIEGDLKKSMLHEEHEMFGKEKLK